jgi:hypothetical protein
MSTGEWRYVTICGLDLEDVEAAGKALLRHHESSAGLRLLAIALRLREQSGFRAADQVFMCDDIDESAGMADVIELHGYSKQVPCA